MEWAICCIHQVIKLAAAISWQEQMINLAAAISWREQDQNDVCFELDQSDNVMFTLLAH